MSQPLVVAFVGGDVGERRITSIRSVSGAGLSGASRPRVHELAGRSNPKTT